MAARFMVQFVLYFGSSSHSVGTETRQRAAETGSRGTVLASDNVLLFAVCSVRPCLLPSGFRGSF